MNTKEIQANVETLINNFNPEEFIYEFLLAYGISKTSITRLKKGDFNLSKNEGEILYKNKIFFKTEDSSKLLDSIDTLSHDENILKHKPRFIIITDNKTLLAKDLKFAKNLDVAISDLPKHHDFFLPLAGSEIYKASNDNEADRDAAYNLAKLFDILVNENPDIYKDGGSNLNIFLSRLLFCFFAEDTGIFQEDNIFINTLIQHTQEDGSDVHTFLDDLFKKLNTKSSRKFPAYLAKFPYVNGGLFRDTISTPKFSYKARKIIKDCGDLQWKEINPDIFGSMIQAVVRPDQRSDLGMHYTSVPNILKLIKPLFLDELYEELEKHQDSIKKLRGLAQRLSKIKFFDPACGSGNFLIITYKEIRLLEIKILKRIIDLSPNPQIEYTQIRLSQFYGIEIDDFAQEMALLSLWIAEHQMNLIFEEELFDYGKSQPLLPLKEAGNITQGNATRINWKDVCPIDDLFEEVYIIGNPPYLGARLQDESQKDDMSVALNSVRGYNNMDYIASWFYKAKYFILGFSNAKAAFVSTNSICQGEQVALIWPNILSDNIEIDFSYRSFKWTNNAKGNAGVIVIIVGIRNISNKIKLIFEENIKNKASNINAYLIDRSNIFIQSRTKPISNFPEISFGNMANDGGNLSLNENEKTDLINSDNRAKKFIRKFAGGREFVNGINRYCLWINENEINEALSISNINDRIHKVENHRLESSREATRLLAAQSHAFGEIRHIETDSIIVPATTSIRREYIPIGFLNSKTIISNSALAIYGATSWLFGIITSKMHLIWVKAIGGRLKTDYRYSAKLCYNTFPFPNITEKQKENLNLYVFAILDARAAYPEKTMAQLYNPDTMPKNLKEAHHELDKAIEQCYRLKPFTSDTERLEYLFKLYEEMSKKDTLFAKQKKKRKRKSKK